MTWSLTYSGWDDISEHLIPIKKTFHRSSLAERAVVIQETHDVSVPIAIKPDYYNQLPQVQIDL